MSYYEPEAHDPERTASEALDDRVNDGDDLLEASAWNDEKDPVAHL